MARISFQNNKNEENTQIKSSYLLTANGVEFL